MHTPCTYHPVSAVHHIHDLAHIYICITHRTPCILSVQVACFATLPGVLEQWAEAAGTDVHAQEVYWVYLPSVLGSAGFVFASYVYVVEVMRDHSILRTDPNPNPNP